MSDKLFQFLDVPRQTPRTVPVAIRVLGYGEISGDFAAPQASTQAERCLDCGNPYCEHACPVHHYIPEWLKLVWIEWLGAERIFELYGGTEGQAGTVITGPEWLAHQGSVGRVSSGEIQIRDAEGNPLRPGEMGEVWMRRTREAETYRYVGAEPRRSDDGWESLGDMGRMDEDGYLYLGDRMQDMILVGGSNVYPAEVEAALQEHPAVRSCVVIGLPDDDLGNRIHAIVEADEATLDTDELLTFLGERLVRYKIPRSVEIVDEALRDDAGKVRRAALRAERI